MKVTVWHIQRASHRVMTYDCTHCKNHFICHVWKMELSSRWWLSYRYHCLSETLNPLLLDQSFQIISNCSVKLLLFWHLSNCMSWSLRSFTLKPSVGNVNMVVDNTLLFRSYKKDNSWAFSSSKPSKENHYLELTSKSMQILSIMILLEIMWSMTMWSKFQILISYS
jgi:hypothetical protein